MDEGNQQNQGTQNNQWMNELRVYSHDSVKELRSKKVAQFTNKFLRQNISYSSRIFLYKQPLCSFHKIDFYHSNATLQQIMNEFGRVCFTFNNTQYAQEPDYNHQPIYSRPLSQDAIEVVSQICQNNFFIHENYRVPINSKLSFFNSVCSRYGRNIHIQYYNTRLSLAQLSSDSIIQQTILKFADTMNRLTITVDSVLPENQRNIGLQQINENFPIQDKFYFKLCIIDGNNKSKKYYVISRKCKANSLKYLLKVIYKQEIKLFKSFSQQKINDEISFDVNLVIAKMQKQQQKIIKLNQQINGIQIVGTISTKNSSYIQVFIMQNSAILHRILVDVNKMQSYVTHICHLPCTATVHLDEDLFFIKDNQLVGFSITINMIKVKYYSLDGELIMIKIFPWYHQLYEIQFSVVDLFCVRLKNDKHKIRVFFIYDPQNYLQVGPCNKFYPAKLGNNVYSDGSGSFAITNHWAQSVQIFSISEKNKISQIKLQNFKQLSNVFFGKYEKNNKNKRNIFLNFGNKMVNVYEMYSKQLLISVLCEKDMNSFCCIYNQLVCSMGSQIRVFGKKNSDNINLSYPVWRQPIFIPQKSAIIIKQQQKYQLLIRDSAFQFDSFKQFYLY